MSEVKFFQINEDGLAFLKSHWWELLDKYGANESDKERTFRSLAEKYSSKGRAYHNLSHIRDLLKFSDSFKSAIKDYDAVCFAIWFHDVIYDTKKSDNEEKSAELAVKILTELKVPDEIRDRARDMILATKKHYPEGTSEDTGLFLDLDLSILGSPEEVYNQYSKAIREEYSWVPGFMYRRNRKKVLNNFLTREKIYFTDDMASRFESQARLNIKNEIKTL
jgi:predicted metal-dependent HD superfamily phosphohydrolase